MPDTTDENRQVKAQIVEKGDSAFTAVASTNTIDRHGESVDANGWELKNYKNNPVLLWAHDHSQMAIGRATKVWIDKTGKSPQLMFKGIWSDATELGRAAKQLVEEGILNSFSVGFLPKDMDGNTYTKQELLEISLVNVPANPDAMMRAYKSLKKSGFEDSLIKDVGIQSEVIDKLVQMDEAIEDLNEKVNTLAKAPLPAAPEVRQTKVLRQRQSLVKAIAKASDLILEGEKTVITDDRRTQLVKVIKRAGEKLSTSHKGELHG